MDYKEGDKIERFKGGSWDGYNQGDLGICTCLKESINTVFLDGNSYGHCADNWRLFKGKEEINNNYQIY